MSVSLKICGFEIPVYRNGNHEHWLNDEIHWKKSSDLQEFKTLLDSYCLDWHVQPSTNGRYSMNDGSELIGILTVKIPKEIGKILEKDGKGKTVSDLENMLQEQLWHADEVQFGEMKRSDY